MKPKIKTILFNLPRAIIPALAVVNFIYFWFESHTSGGLRCFASPWYYPWSYSNEASIILIAGVFLPVNRWWGYLASALFSGYLVFYFIHLAGTANITLAEEFQHLSDPDVNIFLEGDFQYFLALIVLLTAVFYLAVSLKKSTKLKYK